MVDWGPSPAAQALLQQWKLPPALASKLVDGTGEQSAERLVLLLEIDRCLRLLFPEDTALRIGWLTRRNADLDNRTPLEVMLSDQLSGVQRISRFAQFLTQQ